MIRQGIIEVLGHQPVQVHLNQGYTNFVRWRVMLSARLLQFLPHTQTRVSVHTHRAEISIAARFTGQFKRVGPEQGTYFMSPFWHLNYQMAPRFFLETFWTLLLNDTYKSSSYLTDNAIHFYYQVQPGTLPASYKT